MFIGNNLGFLRKLSRTIIVDFINKFLSNILQNFNMDVYKQNFWELKKKIRNLNVDYLNKILCVLKREFIKQNVLGFELGFLKQNFREYECGS